MATPEKLIANDPASADANTAALVEILADAAATGEPVQWPRGEVTLGDQITLGPEAAGTRWVAHDGGTTIRVTPPNVRTLVLYGRGIERYSATYPTTGTLSCPAVPPIPVGSLVRAYRYNGYAIDGRGMMATLTRVVAVQSAGTYSLDTPVPVGCDSVEVYAPGTLPCSGASENSLTLTSASPPPYPAGTLLYVTQGQSAANESTGEYRYVVSVAGNSLRLDRPLRRSLKPAVAVPIQAAGGVVFEGIDFAAPPHPQLESLFAKYAYDVTFRDCTFGTQLIDPNVTTSAAVRFANCTSYGRLMANTSHDVRLMDGRWGGLDAEESCTDLSLDGVLVVPMRHGVRADPLGCRAVRVRDCRIEGSGEIADLAGNRFSALFLSGPDHEVSRTSITGSRGPSYCGGDRLRIADSDSDFSIYVTGGLDCLLSSLRGPYVETRAGSTGLAIGLSADPKKRKFAPGWRVV